MKKKFKALPELKNKIMIVDDEEIVRELLEEVLRSAGYEVVAFSSGLDAESFLKRQGEVVDLLVLDVEMPVIDGEKTLLLLRKIDASLKTIILTGYTSSDKIERIKEIGVINVLHKPIRCTDFLDIIKEVLDN
ncbi:MAG: response regulator [Spirochaetales bacterium]|nr:response regulator [Spirochaetales bacterium]